MSNQEEAIEDEIDSYELNDDFNNNLSQYSRSSTLLMDRFGDESPDEVDESFFRNRKPSVGWLTEQQDKVQPTAKQANRDEDDENNFVTELDVNSDHHHQTTQCRPSVIDSRKDEESLSSIRSSRKSSITSIKNRSQSIINDLPTLLDQDDDSDLPYRISKNVLSIEQLDNITKKDSSSAFMIENINLSLLAKYLIKDRRTSNEIEPDVTWTYDTLITEMSEHHKSA